MSKLTNISAEFIEKDYNLYIKLAKKSHSSVSTKIISPNSFLDLLKESLNDTDSYDTGYINYNLVRHRVSGGASYYVFYYPMIVTDLTIDVPSLRFNHINEIPFFNMTVSNTRCCFKQFKIPHILFVINNKGGYFYNVRHLDVSDEMFDTPIISNNSYSFRSLFPNHYSDSICWGRSESPFVLPDIFKENDFRTLSNMPHLYFKSIFNYDLRPSYEVDYSVENFYLNNKESFIESCVKLGMNEDDISKIIECCDSSIKSGSTHSDLILYICLLKIMFSDMTLYKTYQRSIRGTYNRSPLSVFTNDQDKVIFNG